MELLGSSSELGVPTFNFYVGVWSSIPAWYLRQEVVFASGMGFAIALWELRCASTDGRWKRMGRKIA